MRECKLIYVARRADGVRKLGSCRHVGKRQRRLRSDYKQKYEIEFVLERDGTDAEAVELLAHMLLTNERRIGREHYRLSKKKIIEAVHEAEKVLDEERLFEFASAEIKKRVKKRNSDKARAA